MKTFKQFWNKVNEALDNPADIKWIDKDIELVGFFRVNFKVYSIRCVNKGDNIWSYKFYVWSEDEKKLSPNLTKDNINVFKVLPTIKIGLIYLIEQKEPLSIIYGALDESKGRKKLYDSISKEMSKKYSYEYTTNIKDDKQIFILYKSQLNKDLLMNKIIQITEEQIDI